MAAAAQPLKLIGINPHFGNNGFNHYTEQYDIVEEKTGLVVRRGAPFRVDLRFDNDLDEYDLLTVVLNSEDYGGEDRLKNEWKIKESPKKFQLDESSRAPVQIFRVIQNADKRTLTVVFASRPDAVVSKYIISGVGIWRSRSEFFSSDINFPIYLIFNPFHPEDPVYMDDEAQRKEYALQDQGRVYYGTSRQIGSKPWYFAQYENPVLACALLLLAKSELPWSKWGDPVQVARTLSALVNSNDDNGLLVGNWSGDYADGVSPTEWKGSLKIIKKYFETQEPVQYGQCWVFSGCLTSLARSLGIPARSVTNFDSAHDTDCSLNIDTFFDPDFTPISERNSDSIWNFHVWNDLWMRRADLGAEFDGWQAVDATPQEESGGVFRTGPCPLNGIRRGIVDLSYDSPFVFAEVNACIKHWVVGAGGADKKEVFSDPRKVGQFISTKAVGSEKRDDITSQYKFAEGSAEEAEAFRRAEKLLKVGSRRNDKEKQRNFAVAIKAGADCCVFGNDLPLCVEISSLAGAECRLKFTATVSVKKYNGKVLAQLRQMRDNICLQPNDTHKVTLDIGASEYAGLCGSEEFGFEVLAAVGEEAGEQVVEQSIVNVARPEIGLEIVGEVKQNSNFQFKCSFANTLPIRLTSCRFSVEGPGLKDSTQTCPVPDLDPKAEANCSLSLNPARAGERKFVVSFDSDQLKGVFVEKPITVVAA